MDDVLVTLELHFTPGAIEPFVAGLPSLLEQTRRQPGFVAIAAHRHHDDADRLILVERWNSVADYRRYLQMRIASGLFTELGAILAAPPRIDEWHAPLVAL